MSTGFWTTAGSLLMAVFIAGQAVAMVVRGIRSGARRRERDRRIAEEDAARARRREARAAGSADMPRGDGDAP